MRNASKRLAFKLSLWGIGIGCFGGSIAQAQSLNSGTSQPLKSVMVLTASSGETPIKILSNESSEFVLDQRENEGYVIDGSDLESDTIRERFPDGKVRIERKVVLDDEGNYINHGPYQEWTSKGELVTTGSFVKGKRHGPWIQMCDAKGAKLVTTYPYSKFKAPFQSSVEFDAGMMDGVWTITDADNKVVSQIQLAGGKRDGLTTFFHPNGQVFYQAEYSASLLNGSYIEKSMEGRVVRDEKYTVGQRTEVVQEHFPNKTIKSEISYLSAPHKLIAADQFETMILAEYKNVGERIQNGPFISYYNNGQVKSKGTFEKGKMEGSFESWHQNGQMATSGSYTGGTQSGKWIWWHENGMRQSIANYVRGKADGDVLAWNEQGKRVTSPKTTIDTGLEPTKEIPVSLPRANNTYR